MSKQRVVLPAAGPLGLAFLQMAMTACGAGLYGTAGIAAAIVLTWFVTRAISQLKLVAQAVEPDNISRRTMPWAGDEIGELSRALDDMTAGLERAEHKRAEREWLGIQLLEKVIAAQEEERKRIARELHDEIGQALTAFMVRLKRMNESCPVPTLQSQMEELRQLLAKTLDNVHTMSLDLRPKALDDLGLEAALQRYVRDWQTHHNVNVDLLVLGLEQERLAPAVETALYRIIQEGLTNVARHAQARIVSIVLERRDDLVRVIVEDDGIGFKPGQPGASERFGVYGMQERAELLAGHLTIESTPGQGSSIFVEVPI